MYSQSTARSLHDPDCKTRRRIYEALKRLEFTMCIETLRCIKLTSVQLSVLKMRCLLLSTLVFASSPLLKWQLEKVQQNSEMQG